MDTRTLRDVFLNASEAQDFTQIHLNFPNGKPVPPFLTIEEVAELFNISVGCVRQAYKRGVLRIKPFNARNYRVELGDALKWFFSDH